MIKDITARGLMIRPVMIGMLVQLIGHQQKNISGIAPHPYQWPLRHHLNIQGYSSPHNYSLSYENPYRRKTLNELIKFYRGKHECYLTTPNYIYGLPRGISEEFYSTMET